MEIINLPPIAPTLIESTRAIGYSLEAAIADIVDNSIAANARKIEISFFPLQGAYLSILDDGLGMDSDELTTAMQYGSQNPLDSRNPEDLGRFGLGLKTASLSQCRKLTVASKKDDVIEIRRWDLDFVHSTGQWSLLSIDSSEDEAMSLPEIDRLREQKSGTLVIWQSLDRMEEGTVDFAKSMGKEIDNVRNHLSLVYHRYISGEVGINKINILINGVEVEPADPFMIKKSDQTMQEESYLIHGSVIKIQPYILPHISKMTPEEIKSVGGKEGLRKQQGFYVYRNKRLLVWGTWFRMMRKGELSKLARIRVDIPNTLDSLWTLDIKKSFAIPPEEVRNNLANVIDNIGNKSKIKFSHRGKLEVSDNEVHLWNRMKARDGGYYYEINRNHPIIKGLAMQLDGNDKSLSAVLSQIEKSLPLNQLYVDLNGDEHIENDKAQNDKDIENAIKTMVNNGNDKEQKVNFIKQLYDVLPYKNHKSVLNKVIMEVINDE